MLVSGLHPEHPAGPQHELVSIAALHLCVWTVSSTTATKQAIGKAGLGLFETTNILYLQVPMQCRMVIHTAS